MCEGSSSSVSLPMLVIMFLNFRVLLNMKWYVIMVLIYIFQMTNDVDDFFVCMLAICMS